MASQVRIERQEGNRTIYVNTNIFDQSYIDDKDLTFVVQVKKSALPYFNDISNWTRFALEQATSLHSTYSKRLFMYLKQWRTVGKRTFSRDEFAKKLYRWQLKYVLTPDLYTGKRVSDVVMNAFNDSDIKATVLDPDSDETTIVEKRTQNKKTVKNPGIKLDFTNESWDNDVW